MTEMSFWYNGSEEVGLVCDGAASSAGIVISVVIVAAGIVFTVGAGSGRRGGEGALQGRSIFL